MNFKNFCIYKNFMELLEESPMIRSKRFFADYIKTVSIPIEIKEYVFKNNIIYKIESYDHGQSGVDNLISSFFIDEKDNIFAVAFGNESNPVKNYELVKDDFIYKNRNPLYLSSTEKSGGVLTTRKIDPPFRN